MRARITDVSKDLQSLGFTYKIDFELSKDIEFLDKAQGIYNKNIDAKQLFLSYDIFTFEYEYNEYIEYSVINVSVCVELYQITCEFDTESGLKYCFDLVKDPLAYFCFDVYSEEKCYVNDEWNQDAEDALREIAVAKVIEIENLIWNKIKEA